MDDGRLCSICCSLLKHAVAILLLRLLSRVDLSAICYVIASLTDFAEVEVGVCVYPVYVVWCLL